MRCTFYRDTQQWASDAFVEDRNKQLATWCRRSHINVRLVLRQLQRIPVVEEKSIRIRIKEGWVRYDLQRVLSKVLFVFSGHPIHPLRLVKQHATSPNGWAGHSTACARPANSPVAVSSQHHDREKYTSYNKLSHALRTMPYRDCWLSSSQSGRARSSQAAWMRRPGWPREKKRMSSSSWDKKII